MDVSGVAQSWRAQASRSTPERDARPTDLDLGQADAGSGQQILDQRLGNPLVLEVIRPRHRSGSVRGLDVLAGDEIVPQELLVAHRAIAVLLLELSNRRLRRFPGLHLAAAIGR